MCNTIHHKNEKDETQGYSRTGGKHILSSLWRIEFERWRLKEWKKRLLWKLKPENP
jgi:hypothetical protein